MFESVEQIARIVIPAVGLAVSEFERLVGVAANLAAVLLAVNWQRPEDR